MKKWLSPVKKHTIVRVGTSKKPRPALGNRARKNVDFRPKIEAKSEENPKKMVLGAQIGAKMLQGVFLPKKSRILDNFGAPAGT